MFCAREMNASCVVKKKIGKDNLRMRMAMNRAWSRWLWAS